MNYCIFLSGGMGTRAYANLPKQYIRAGKYIMTSYSLIPLINSKRIDEIIVVVSRDYKDFVVEDLKKNDISCEKLAAFVVPGDTRQLSIINGLRWIEDNRKAENRKTNNREENKFSNIVKTDTVLIHDGARPFLTKKLIDDIYDAFNNEDIDGVMPAIQMKDTLYLSEDGRQITKLLDRSKIVAGQTPELFDFEKYLKANNDLIPEEIKKISGSSQVALNAGMKLKLIPGDENNFKITTKKDLDEFKKIKNSEF